MTTQTQTDATKSTGRNRGTRRGSNQPDPKLNIGAGLQGKKQTPAVVITPQTEGDAAMEQVKLSRKTLNEAAKIVAGFHAVNDELVSLKTQTEAKRGGLSDIVFQLCKVGVNDAPKPDLRLAACVKVLDAAEAWERQRYQKEQKLAELPAAKVALGTSWQTYKSQILKCVRAGLNPADFKNGTVFREAMSKTGNKARKPRQSSGADAAQATANATMEGVTLRAELSAALVELVKQLQGLDEETQMEYAKRVHKLAVTAAKEDHETTEETPKEEAPKDQANVGTM